jgi:hypothetical protein
VDVVGAMLTAITMCEIIRHKSNNAMSIRCPHSSYSVVVFANKIIRLNHVISENLLETDFKDMKRQPGLSPVVHANFFLYITFQSELVVKKHCIYFYVLVITSLSNTWS